MGLFQKISNIFNLHSDKEGVDKTYYFTGELKSETPYKDNNINGVVKIYSYLFDEVIDEINIKDGKLDGKHIYCDFDDNSGCWFKKFEIVFKNGRYISGFEKEKITNLSIITGIYDFLSELITDGKLDKEKEINTKHYLFLLLEHREIVPDLEQEWSFKEDDEDDI
tara:strand:- start:390 stop:887 length:498 start_codon:yes stop_codon:yes gene_type:complete